MSVPIFAAHFARHNRSLLTLNRLLHPKRPHMSAVKIVHFTLLASFIVLVSSASMIADDFSMAKDAVKDREWVAALGHIRKAVAAAPQDMDVLKVATTIYLEMDIKDTALTYARRLFEDDKDEEEHVLLYAQALRKAGQPAEAVGMLRKALRKRDDVDVSLELVNALVDADSTRSAELVATTARDKYPKNATVYIALGNIYFNSKPFPVFELAVQNYEEAIKLDASYVMAYFNLAICYWKMANRESDKDLKAEYVKRSFEAWDNVTDRDPKNARAWYEQGKILNLVGRYTQASQALLRYRELRPLGTGENLASWYLGESYYKQNKCDSAKIHLDDVASRVDSLRPHAALMLAKCSFTSRQWQECVKAYTQSLPVKSRWENMDYWFYGVALVVSGDTTNAIAAMGEAAERDPKQCTFMFRYGLLLQDRGMYARSTEIYRKRLEYCNDTLDPKIHVFIGNNFYADSLLDSAAAAYEKALSIKPGYQYAKSRLGDTYIAKGLADRGEALLNEVVENGKVSTNPEDRKLAVGALARLNDRALQAKEWSTIVSRSKVATELDPKSVSAWLYLAIGYQGLQDAENAKKAYREVLKLNPNNEAAKKNLKALGG